MYFSASKDRNSVMTAATACASLLALISFFLPFAGKLIISLSGFDLLSWNELFDTATWLVLALIATIISLCASVATLLMNNRKMLYGVVAMALFAAISLLVFFGDRLDRAAVGFWLCLCAHLCAGVMSVVVLASGEATPAANAMLRPCPSCGKMLGNSTPFCPSCGAKQPTPAARVTCTNCGAEIRVGAAFCDKCGTRRPDTAGKMACPHCGAALHTDAAFCDKCGSPLHGSGPHTAKTAYQGAADPTPAGKEGKTVCPHCGARQSAENARCRYCGTPLR